MTVADAVWVGGCRFFLRASSDPGLPIDRESAGALAHARLDWDHLANYLCGSGLARPLAARLNDPVLTRSVPRTFLETLSRRAVFDVLRERAQRDAIGRIGEALHALGARGVLLKGSAFLVRTVAPFVPRGTSDVDVLVDADLAPRLRRHLLARGFEGAAQARPSVFHHLAPIAHGGVEVEIHTRMMPAFWGVPESALLSEVRPVAGWDGLDVPGGHALIAHSVVHGAASFFAFGLKTAWDILAVLRDEPDFDWAPLLAWSSMLRAPRAFWAPLRVLSDALDLPVPSAFLRHAPTDRGMRRVEAIARQRMLSSTESLGDLDVVTKTAATLLLLEDWSSRLGYLGAALRWRISRPGTWRAAGRRARHADVLHQAWRQYRRYRRNAP